MEDSARHHFDTWDYIDLWDYTPAELFDRVVISGSSGPLLDSILNFISKIGSEDVGAATSSLSRSPSLAATTLGRFRIWTKSFDGDECDLVTVVDYSPQLKETVTLLLSGFAGVMVGLFGHLCDSETLLELNSALSQLLPTSSSPTSSESEDADGSEDLEDDPQWDEDSEIQHLKCLVDALFQLLPALEETLEEIVARKERTQTLLRTFNVEEIYSDIISAKYPKAPAFLSKRLARGVIGASDRLGLFRDEEVKKPVSVVPATTRISFQDSGLGTSLGTHEVAQLTNPLTFQDSRPTPSVAGSMFSDLSDLLTVKSPNLDRQHRMALPSMPEPGASCPICFDKKTFSAKSHWRKHAFSDLMPYMCINTDCTTSECQQSFKTWREWMQHDQSVHSITSDKAHLTEARNMLDTATPPCPFGCRVIRHSSGDGWYRHVGHHMEDIRLLALPPSLRLPCSEFEGDLSSTSSSDTGDPKDLNARGLPVIQEELSSNAGSNPAALRNVGHGGDGSDADSGFEGPPVEIPGEEVQQAGAEVEPIVDVHPTGRPKTMDDDASIEDDDAAIEDEEQAIAMQTMTTNLKTFGQEHPDTLTSMTNLARIFDKRRRWKEEEELLEQIIEIRKKVFGQEHPDTLFSMGNLAQTYRNQGRLEEAEKLEAQVLEIQMRVLGQEHPDTLASTTNLASTWKNQGRWREAEELEVQVLEIRKRLLGQEHPSTLISMTNLAMTWKNQGRWREAEELEVQVLEIKKRVLGQEHPDTLTSMGNLAMTWKKLGWLKEAEELEVQALEIKKRVLGQDHPDTLTSMNNLAFTYKIQSRIDEAIALMAKAVTLRSRILGEEHPYTKGSIKSLTQWRGEVEKPSEYN